MGHGSFLIPSLMLQNVEVAFVHRRSLLHDEPNAEWSVMENKCAAEIDGAGGSQSDLPRVYGPPRAYHGCIHASEYT